MNNRPFNWCSHVRATKYIYTEIDAEKKILPVTDRDTFKKSERRINLSVINRKCLPSPSLYGWPPESEDKHDHDLVQNCLKGCCFISSEICFWSLYATHNLLGKSSVEKMNAECFPWFRKGFRYIYNRHSMLRRQVSLRPATTKTFKSN